MRRREKRSFKLKLIYRVLILLAIFIGALWYFSGHYLVIRNFQVVTGETEMSEASIPYLTMMVGKQEMNRLCGYTANLDWTLNRETITPLNSEQTFTVKIYENKMTVRKLKYELYDVSTGNLLEESTISALSEDSFPDCKSAQIKLKTSLTRGVEYSVKITLVTSDSKRIYYYTRVKSYNNGYLTEKIDYTLWFRNSLLNKQNQLQIEKNLETKSNADRTNFAHVDINSNWTMASWGSMQPKLVAELPPTITDFYEEYASIVLNYLVEVETESGTELIQVRETFRLLYTTIRTYLYTYDRVSETVYDVDDTYLLSSDLKLGITNDTDMQILTTSSYKFTALVHGGELWSYSSASNEMSRVFSFKNDDEYALDPAVDDHEIKILGQNEKGDIDFVVYGYMSRGEYEGRVGISFYHYNQANNRISELAHIPVNTTYELLKGEMTDLTYRSSKDIIYIAIFDTVYSYNITTKGLTAIAEDVPEGHLAYLSGDKKIIWQECSNDAESEKLIMLDLESGAKSEWTTSADEVICLLGQIDNNAIVGYAKKADICRNSDGSETVPMYKVAIVNAAGDAIKTYQESGCYVTNASVSENMIVLDRVKKRSGSTLSYESISQDGISNRASQTTGAVSVVSRSSTTMKTEYYVAFPANITMKNVPTWRTVSLELLDTDRNVRIVADGDEQTFYRTYSFGRVVTRTAKLWEAIKLADSDEGLGAVIDDKGRLVWERGVKATRSGISGITIEKATNMTSLQACLKMLFKYEGYDVDTTKIDFSTTDVMECMQQCIKVTGVNLKGISGDQMLYYVYKKRPVIAITSDNTALLIIGYDANYIEYIDPVSGSAVKILKGDAADLFETNGNTFYSYIK